MPDPTPESVAVDDLRFVARNLRDQGATAAAERVDALADDIATAHVATAGGEDQACIDADVDATDAASVDARLPEPARAPALEGPTALLTARIRPPVDAEAAVEVLDKVLSGAGVEHRVLDVDSTTGTVEIEAAVDAPPAEGCVLIAGSFKLGDAVHEVVVVTGGEPAPDLATALGADGAVPGAPVAFRVVYSLDGGRLDDETILPVLDAASRTLSYFGELVPVTVVHLADHSVVDYAVLNPGPVSTARIAQGATGWGGTITVPGVGQVTATLEL